jgi:GcrA cell cycle regulator
LQIWTDERVELLKKLALVDGMSGSLIAHRLGTSRNAVLGKLWRLGIGVGSNRPRKVVIRRTGRPLGLRRRLPKTHQRSAPKKPMTAFQKLLADEPSTQPEPFVCRPLPVIPEHEQKTLIDLDDNDCRFPTTERPPHKFCGRERVRGLPYCKAHALVAYDTVRTQASNAAAIRAEPVVEKVLENV